jgi:hypothetical protein
MKDLQKTGFQALKLKVLIIIWFLQIVYLHG